MFQVHAAAQTLAGPAVTSVDVSSGNNSETVPVHNSNVEGGKETESVLPPKRPKPTQDKCNQKVQLFEKQLNNLLLARDSMPQSEELTTDIKLKKQQLDEAQKKLKNARRNAEYQQKSRNLKKIKLNEMVEKYPEAKDILKLKEKPGQPRLEDDCPALCSVIMEIAKFGSGADDRRQTESIRTVKSLDELTNELNARGFKISR